MDSAKWQAGDSSAAAGYGTDNAQGCLVHPLRCVGVAQVREMGMGLVNQTSKALHIDHHLRPQPAGLMGVNQVIDAAGEG